MKTIRSYRIFQFVLMAYLIAAFSWWAILLLKENRELYHIKKEYQYPNNIEMQSLIEKDFNRARTMIIGEGIVFAVSILVSFYLINRAFWTEIKANKKQNNFLLSVTHELKTPIATLKLINATLRKDKISADKKNELLSTAYDENLRLESLVNNILTVAQMDNDYNYNFEKVDITEILQERKKRFEKIYPEAELILESEGGPFFTLADREALTKMADNIIDNAIKYSDTVKKAVIKIGRESGHVFFSVADDGPGIDDNEKKRVADKFYRIGDEDRRVSKGTGLGLFIVNEICKAHKAQLKISDNQPRGSIFKVIFRHS